MFSHTSELSKEKCLKKIEDGAQDVTSNSHAAILGEINCDNAFSLKLSRTTLSTDIVRQFHGTVEATPQGTVIEGKFKYSTQTLMTWGALLLISLLAVVISSINPTLFKGFYLPPSICRVILVFVIFLISLYSYTGRHQERKLLEFLTEL